MDGIVRPRRAGVVRARRAAASLGLSPLLLAALVAWQARKAFVAEYLPDPGHVVHHVAGSGAGQRRVAVLGDSTVAGLGSPSPERTLPALLAERLAERLGCPVAGVGYGVSGARTRDITDQAARLGAERFDAVVVIIGSNDVTHLAPVWRMRARTRETLRALREAVGGGAASVEAVGGGAAGAGETALVLGGIPEFATVPALDQPLRALAGAYAVALRERQRAAAADAGVPFVDIAAEASPRFLGRPESMSADGFHPSDVGYGMWADALAPAVAAQLADSSRPGP